MKHTKQEKAEYLLSEIGGVKDAFLQEALAYQAPRRVRWRLPTAIAASVLALLCCLPLLWNAWRSPLPSDGTHPSVPNDFGAEGPNGGADSIPLSLDVVLSEAEPDRTLASLDEIDYFGGAYLIWQNTTDRTLKQSRRLTQEELDRICALIGTGTPVGTAAEPPVTRIWLVIGNGEVLTPYLPATAGNISAVLFDYNAEILPSAVLISCISDILGNT